MGRKRNSQILTGVEIGTSSIKVVMGEFADDDVLTVTGVGESPSLKVRKGEVFEADIVQEQLQRALDAAEKSSGEEIRDNLFLAVTGAHIQTVNSTGNTLVRSVERMIEEEDVVTAARTARAYNLPPDREVLHYFDRLYRIDDSREVANPTGLVGTKLEADVHLIYGYNNRLETNRRLLADLMGVPATDSAFSPVAAGFAAFSPEEMEKGGLLIDIGAGVTEYVVLHGSGCYHSGQLAVGCDHAANDISLGLDVPFVRCRNILREFSQFGTLDPDHQKPAQSRRLPLGELPEDRDVSVTAIEQIVGARIREILEIVHDDLKAHGALERVGCGVKLCGGGAMLPGIVELCRLVFGKIPVAVAVPRRIAGKTEAAESPRFMVPVGLLRYGRLTMAIGEPQFVPLSRQMWLDIRRLATLVRQSFQW